MKRRAKSTAKGDLKTKMLAVAIPASIIGVCLSIVLVLIWLAVFSKPTEYQTVKYETILDKGTRYYEAPYHLQPIQGEIVYESEKEDYRIVETQRLEFKEGDEVFSPSLGFLKVSKVTDTELWIANVDLAKVAPGLSGERVLTASLKNVAGFISRLEDGQLVIVRMRTN